jgi:aspartate kinase
VGIVVQKFGGTSVADFDRIQNVVDLALNEKAKGNDVVVVVSAMAGVTDSLIKQARQFSKLNLEAEIKEYDSIISTGEQVSSGLTALAFLNRGHKAESLLGWQLPIETDDVFSSAKVQSIKVDAIQKLLSQGIIPVIAGFQGIYEGRITTLGRGGSDTTAAAVAAALKADRCDIYTDVDGVYSADPRVVSRARKLRYIAFEEMLEMAGAGAKVLHSRSVEIAMKYNLKLRVLSSFNSNGGTMVVSEEDVIEKQVVTGITCERDMASLTIKGLSDNPGAASNLFLPFKQENIKVDLIVQNIGSKGKTDMTITMPQLQIQKALSLVEANEKVNYRDLIVDDNLAKISVIGIGMKTHSGVAQKMFQILADRGINILVVSTSEIKISVLIHSEYQELAMRALHTGFGLDK